MRKIAFVAILLAASGASVFLSVNLVRYSLHDPWIFERDLISDYLSARAILDGENPYEPIPVLQARYLPNTPDTVLRHSNPHPPPLLLLTLPLGLLRYRIAAALWVVLEFALLFLSAFLIRRALAPKSSMLLTCAITLLFLYATPISQELRLGQMQLVLLPILCLAWIDLRAKRESRGGIWLGLLVSLKLFAWPLVFYFAMKRRWRIVGSIVVVVLGANFLAAVSIGIGPVKDCYFKAGPEVATIYSASGTNFSASALARRPFEGVKSGPPSTVEAPPLWSSPFLADIAGFVAPLLLLVCGLWMARQATDFEPSFGMMVCVSLLANPISWQVYFILAIVPVAIAAGRLRLLRYPFWPTVCFCLACLPPFQPFWTIEDVGFWLGSRSDGVTYLSSGAGIAVTIFPALALVCLFKILLWLDSRQSSA